MTPPAPAPRGARACLAARAAGAGRLCAAMLLCMAAAASFAPAHAQTLRDTVEVLSVEVEGTEQLPEALVRSVVATLPTRCVSAALQPLCWFGASLDRRYLDPRMLTADLLRLRLFYHQRGFREARVELDTASVANGIHITFRIREGEPVIVASVQVEGAEELGGITRSLPLRAGQPLSMVAFEATRDTLIARLANRGYAAADVLANYEIQAQDARAASVEYQLIPGPLTRFGAIEITGLSRVSPRVVRRMLTFEEGDLYSRQALARSQRNLFSLEVFRHAEIMTAAPTETDSVLPVRVQVNEGDLHRIRVGVGLSTAEFLNAEGRWISRNFMGGARRLELRGRASNLLADPLGPALQKVPGFQACTGIYCDPAGSISADFTQPWFFDPANTLGAGLFLERLTLPGVYVRTSRGGYLSVSRSFSRTGAVSLGYRPELTRLESDGDLIFCVNFVVCEEREINVLRESHWLAPLALSVGLDRSNNLFSPTGGWIFRLDGEYAARETGSDFDYVRLQGEGTLYHDPFRGVVIATRVRPGWARAVGAPGQGLGLHPQKRFFGGGPNSVRGFAQYRLGPKLLTVGDARDLVGPRPDWDGCTAQEINAGTCDVGELARTDAGEFTLQPVGGAALLEANIEARFPIWRDLLRGAVFMDFGQVWQTPDDIDLRQLAWTPGAGIRYFSPIGPIRIDIGYNPGGAETLPVVTTEVCYRESDSVCSEILPDRTYTRDELGTLRKLRALPAVTWNPYRSFVDRLQFHFSIGQAF
jgi:outer membrane protein assembly factor BamA